MLRVILRNVQYYLLFFSALLVLLAFRRLQWYDQGWVHPYAFIDHPMHGGSGGRFSMNTSPDNAGRVYYGGDESKEIGLFKFRLGLLKFVLPTFSRDDASWERTSEFMTVPPPPNKRRKSAGREYLRVKAQGQVHAKHGQERVASRQGEAPKPSVAYIVIMPRLPRRSKLQVAPNSKTMNKADVIRDIDRSFDKRAKALSQSIKRVHTSSPYDYQLFALNLDSASDDDDYDNSASKLLRTVFSQLGFKTINVDQGGLEGVANDLKHGIDSEKFQGAENKQDNLLGSLTQQDVIVQISLNSIVLKPMDDLFDVLLKGGSGDTASGLSGIRRESSLEGAKVDEQAKPAGTIFTRVDSFTLESSHPSAVESELSIFSSRYATTSYLNKIGCLLSQSRGEQATAVWDGSDGYRPMLSQSGEAERSQAQRGLNVAPCVETHAKDNSLQLDRCMFSAGNSGIDGNCNRDRVRDDARVVHFSNDEIASAGAAMRLVAKGKGGSQNNGHLNKMDQTCFKPWECSDLEDCSKRHGHGHDDICTWLYSKWFDFVDSK